MSVFLVRYSVSGSMPPLSADALRNYLPHPPQKIETFSIGTSEAVVWSFNAALDRRVNPIRKGELVLCHGYGGTGLEGRAAEAFKSGRPLNLNSFPEAFCAIRMHRGGIEFGGSAVGIDALFFYEDADQLIVTNRHNLLAPWVAGTDIRKAALIWMVGRTHIGDFGTLWDAMKRTRPGSTYIKAGAAPLVETKATFSDLFEPIPDREINDYVSSAAATFQGMLNDSSSEARLWLSGGKDSRAIAGILSGSPRFRDMSLTTHGERFAPDVMSAKLIAKALGVANRHAAARQLTASPSINIAERIIGDMLCDSSGGSLADLRVMQSSPLLIFGGHENGFKTKANPLDISEYLDSRKYWTLGSGAITGEAHTEIHDWYISELRQLLEQAPKSRFPQLDALIFRNGTFLTGPHVNSHISRSEVHPFLDGRMVRLLLGVSDRALDNQLIHYVMTRQSDVAIESLPFANDAWPKDTMAMAKEIGLPFRGQPEKCFPYQPYFPSQKVYGAYSWRLELIQRTKPFIWEYLNDNRDFFDFIDLDRVAALAERNPGGLQVMALYYHLALLKVVLVHHFSSGDDLFSFGNAAAMADRLSKLFDASATQATSDKDIIRDYSAKLDDYEDAIAAVAMRDRGGLDDEINIRVASKVAILLKDDNDAQEKALKELGLTPLTEPVELGALSSFSRISGVLLSMMEQNSSALLAVKNRPETAPLNGFRWSDSGKFWFLYLTATPAASPFSLTVDCDEHGGDLCVIPWYPKATIWFCQMPSSH